MSKDKQIGDCKNRNDHVNEMAREMCHLSAECKTCQICDERYLGDGEPCYFQCVAIEIIKHGYRKQEWISVEERLPEIEQIVLCCLGLVQNVYTYKGDNTWEDSYGYYQKDEPITHWMPLPELPKMKGGAE